MMQLTMAMVPNKASALMIGIVCIRIHSQCMTHPSKLSCSYSCKGTLIGWECTLQVSLRWIENPFQARSSTTQQGARACPPCAS